MYKNQITPAEISSRLSAQAESVARMLLPSGKLVSGEWCVGSTSGDEGKSCKIKVHGDRAGIWKDFSTDEKGGDLLDLWAQVHNIPLAEAIKEACEYLGIERPKFEGGRKRLYAKPEKPAYSKKLSEARPSLDWLQSRGISPRTAALYGVFANGDTTVVFPYMRNGEVLHLKFRDTKEKKFFSSKDTEKMLFGWNAVNPMSRWVILTEGEMDALALAEYGFPAMSIPFGGGGAGKQDWIENEFDNLERFDTIYLSMDADEAGRQALADIVDRLGRHRCKIIELPYKDANDCLMKGVEKIGIENAIKSARTLDPRELRNVTDFRDQVIELYYPPTKEHSGFYMPWESMTSDFRFEWGATTLFAGFNGHGKSELVGQIALDSLAQGVKCCVASLEFKPGKWIARLVRQATCKIDPAISEIDASMQWMSPNLWVFDVWGTAKIDRILEVFVYARQRYGIKCFVIDNFSKLGIAEDDLNEQKRAISAITEFGVAHDVHVLVVAHLRKEDTELQMGGKLGVRGSGTITDLVDNLFIVWRNKPKEHQIANTTEFNKLDQEKRNEIRSKPDTILRCEKYRSGEEEPRIPLWYDKPSHQFVDRNAGMPCNYMLRKK